MSSKTTRSISPTSVHETLMDSFRITVSGKAFFEVGSNSCFVRVKYLLLHVRVCIVEIEMRTHTVKTLYLMGSRRVQECISYRVAVCIVATNTRYSVQFRMWNYSVAYTLKAYIYIYIYIYRKRVRRETSSLRLVYNVELTRGLLIRLATHYFLWQYMTELKLP